MYETNEFQWLLSIGRPLKEYNIFDWALTKKEAIDLLDVFKYFNIPIYGGDVYILNHGVPKRTGDTWSVAHGFDSYDLLSIQTSIKEAKEYVENYDKINPDSYYTLTTRTIPSGVPYLEAHGPTIIDPVSQTIGLPLEEENREFYELFKDLSTEKNRDSNLSEKVEFLVALFQQFLKEEDVKVIREFNLTDTPLSLEILTLILADAKRPLPVRIYEEIKKMLIEANLDLTLLEGLNLKNKI